MCCFSSVSVTCSVCGLSVIKDTVACYIKLCRGERTKFDTFVDPNVRGAQRRGDLLKYESIVIEFFLRLKIHRICADVPRFDIENLNFIVSMAEP